MKRFPTHLAVLVALVGCDVAVGPDAVPGPGRSQDLNGTNPTTPSLTTRPGARDDPRARVFEELGPPEVLADRLAEGECILHYRRGARGYTPIPFRLPLAKTPGDSLPPVRLVVRAYRGELLTVRAVCLVPRSKEGISAVKRVRERMRLPALEQAPDGSLQLFDPAGESTASTSGLRGSSPVRTMLQGISALIARVPEGWRPGPTALLAAQDYDPPWPPPPDCQWVSDGSDWALDCDDGFNPITCQDPDKHWDEALQACVCPEGEVDLGNGCEVPQPPPDDPPPPDTTSGGGGSSEPGGGDDGGDDPPPPPPASVTVSLHPTQVQPQGQTTVIVTVDPGVAGYDVQLSATGVANSGGHEHTAARPVGTFGDLSGSTDENGVFQTTYTASEFGGAETIKADINSVEGEEDLEVKVAGLTPLGTGMGYVLKGSNDAHPGNHYGTAIAVAGLQAIADDYASAYPGSVLWYNDMSLERGGLFDIGPPYGVFWHTPHDEHRLGTNCDVKKTDPGGVPLERRTWLEAKFIQHGSNNTYEEANHWHLRF
ncbi:MAG TPA: hypothetical protein VE173_13270 [Longimicrobiales bacterium]|nr:hypothetical protein [Longimicrobiales bacterium]